MVNLQPQARFYELFVQPKDSISWRISFPKKTYFPRIFYHSRLAMLGLLKRLLGTARYARRRLAVGLFGPASRP